ncbi:hypothetical protein GQ457_05G024050 [Hibiscus cannabinus]
MIPLILPSTCLTIFSYHLNDINQRCLRNAPLKIDIYVMQSHMPFTHSNNNNNYDNIHNNKKFKPTHKAKPTTTYSRA